MRLQIGKGTIGIAVPEAKLGSSGQPNQWLDQVACRGNELRVEACANAGWGVSDW